MNARIGVVGILSLVVAVVVAHVVGQVFFVARPFGGEAGLLALYAETAVAGVGLAALRVLGRRVERPERRPTRHFAHWKGLPEKKEHRSVDLEVRRAS